MDIAIHFDNQPCFVAIKIDNESHNDLLSSEMDAQLVGAWFLPKNLFSGCHVTAEFFCTLEFFFGDFLFSNNILERHGGIVMQNVKPLSRLP